MVSYCLVKQSKSHIIITLLLLFFLLLLLLGIFSRGSSITWADCRSQSSKCFRILQESFELKTNNRLTYVIIRVLSYYNVKLQNVFANSSRQFIFQRANSTQGYFLPKSKTATRSNFYNWLGTVLYIVTKYRLHSTFTCSTCGKVMLVSTATAATFWNEKKKGNQGTTKI